MRLDVPGLTSIKCPACGNARTLAATLSNSKMKLAIKSIRLIVLFLFTVTSLCVCGQSDTSKVTVIFFDNQTPNSKIKVDTLYKDKLINLAKTPIDLFFISNYFKLPYYVPTDGFYKNEAKEKECDMKLYPRNVKCYEYDQSNRVIKMSVNGSGTMNNFSYKYNDKNQIVEILDNGFDKFILKYNVTGAISDFLNINDIYIKHLVFLYK